MIEALREVTNWDVPNHLYIVQGDKLLGYIKQGSKQGEMFKTPKRFDRRYRKFVKVSLQPHPYPKQFSNRNVVYVQGSRGATYEIDKAKGTCSCSSFKFRGRCKHLKELGIG